jgi:serine/threonine protein kinase
MSTSKLTSHAQNVHTTHATTPTFVLKTCSSHAVQYHQREVHAYKAMGGQVDVMPNMVRFYGSWRQGNTYYMLLEYVNGGTLESFFQDTPSPTRQEEILMFWERLFDLVNLVARVHKHPNPNSRHEYLQG